LRSSESGLIYSCNTDAHIGYDIAALGATSGLGGIASAQGTDIYLGGAIMATGNVLDGSDYNLYNTQQMFNYNYDHLITDQRPIRYTIPKVNLTSSSEQGECPSGTIILPTNGTITTTGLGSAHYSLAAANINYYMTSKRAASHRDSLYYWAGQLGTAYGDLLTTNLLIEDGYTDSAQNIYDSIINKYALDSNSTEGNDFVQGRNLIDLLVYKQLNSEPLMTLTTTEISALKSITANSQMWAHVRAENWLYAYEGDPITDTLLYPNPSDTGNVDSTQRKANLTGYNQSSKIPNQVFPNPAHDQLEVIYTALTNDPITIEIQDISGRTIITQSLQSGVTASVNISNLVPGMYLYRIMEGPNTTMIGKVAKE